MTARGKGFWEKNRDQEREKEREREKKREKVRFSEIREEEDESIVICAKEMQK